MVVVLRREMAVRSLAIGMVMLVGFGAAQADEPTPVAPFEIAGGFTPVNPIDEHVLADLKRRGITPAALCSDAVFLRRVYLDVIGTLPTPDAAAAFLTDRRSDKRARLIDELLERDEYADYWALKWCDVLRVKSEFPINLWPNAVQAYHHWVRDALATNMPYDEFARELLTSTGSNFRVPPVNFYRAVQGQEPGTLASAVALTFMGTRLGTWPAERRASFEAFFSRLAFKSTAEWKEEIVYVDPAATKPLDAVLPDGLRVRIVVGQDPRRVLADWLIDADNEWFARCAVNRVWAWLFGRGIIHEPDDIRPDNPPANPQLLAYLEDEFVRCGYDLKHIYRRILNSRTYQQSSIARCADSRAAEAFACYPVRRLDAEVLIDALNGILGSRERYRSMIPEPFTYIPEEQRTIALADGSITSPFLEMFGRPSRDSGLMSERNNRPTRAQRLHLLNSSQVYRKITQSGPLRELVRRTRRDDGELVRTIYLAFVSRPPTADEERIVDEYFGETPRAEAVVDLVWALINSKEFLYRH